MKAVILAGGFGTRLSEETERIPKPMVEIGGKPILWHIMKIYSYYGITDFIICLGYRSYVIKEYFSNYLLHMSDITIDMSDGKRIIHQNMAEPWKVTLVDTGYETMTGGRILRIKDYVNDGTFCMTYGDGLSDIDLGKLIEFHNKHKRLATVTSITPPGRFGNMEIQDDIVINFGEKKDNKDININAGFFVLEPEVMDYIIDDSTIWERDPMEKLANEKQLMAYHHSGFWQAMDTLREKNSLEELWRSGKAPWKRWS